jgi:hypothetical protein
MIKPDARKAASPTKPGSTPVKGVSLNEGERILKQHLGLIAPSRITLHRHSASGYLDHLVVRQSTNTKVKRTYYDPEQLVSYYKGRAPAPESISAKSAPAAPAPSAEVTLNPDQFNTMATDFAEAAMPLIEQRIAAALAPFSTVLTDISRQVAELAGVRQSLMLKYDSVATLNQQKLDRAEAEVRALKAGGGAAEQQLSKISIDISRLRDAVNDLRSNLIK